MLQGTANDTNVEGNNIFTTRSLHKNSLPLETLNSRAQQYREDIDSNSRLDRNLDFRNPSENQMKLVNKNDPYLLEANTFQRKYEKVADTIRQAANTSAVSLSEVLPSIDYRATNNSGATIFKVFYDFDYLCF